MSGEYTAEIGIELQKIIIKKYGDQFLICVDHVSDKKVRQVAILELEDKTEGVNISHPDIAILEKNPNHEPKYSGEIAVLCEVEERSRGDVKQLCGDLLSMFLAKRARVVSMNENDETYFASINPNILTVYCRIEDTPEIDDTRWICMNDALSQNRAAFNRSVILQRAENKEKMKQIVITNVLFLLNEWVLRNKTNV